MFTKLTINKNIKLPKGEYVLSGGVNSPISDIRLYLNNQVVYQNQVFSIENDTDIINNVYIYVYKDSTISTELTYYPMIRPAEITDDTYEPYKPSVEERLNDIVNQIFGLGTNIPSGADLNDYTQPGVYKASSSAIAASLLNCPVSGAGFRFEVCYTVAEIRFMQKLYLNSMVPQIFIRTYGTNGFGSWYKIPLEVVTTT